MHEIDASNARDYLNQQGMIAPQESVIVRALTGGVSNMVLLVEREPPAKPLVLKQARRQLRTRQEWFAPLERALREIEVLQDCERLLNENRLGVCRVQSCRSLPDISTPQILFADPANFAFAMSAAPADARTWKELLLAGQSDTPIAAACGHLLGTLHAGSWHSADLGARLADRSLFEQLRVDPYYRAVQKAHPRLSPRISELIDSLHAQSLALVHADFSPKNLLVSAAGLMMIDFETGHFGDPAFDLGFFLSHLLLKSIYHAPATQPYLDLACAFWQSYLAHLAGVAEATELSDLEQRAVLNLAGCLLARVDGKSPVEYLTDPRRQQVVRQMASDWLTHPPAELQQCFAQTAESGAQWPPI